MKKAGGLRRRVADGFAIIMVFCAFLFPRAVVAQDTPIPVSIIELMASSQKYSGKVISVEGYLVIGQGPKHGVEADLYLHEEDARNLLGYNMLRVLPSKQMIINREKISRMYVILTGLVKTVQAENGLDVIEITHVQSCVPWSNPDRPLSH